jgi:hypothetical protein
VSGGWSLGRIFVNGSDDDREGHSSTDDSYAGVQLGKTVLFARRTRSQTCKRGALPDRRCSPGAYSSKLTKAVICSSTFRTGSIRNVPTSEKHAVETEYGMVAKSYGRTIEIDHIVSLELGGSNDIANLYPEPGSGKASYHVKDKLENRLHSMLCAGSITLAAARRGTRATGKSSTSASSVSCPSGQCRAVSDSQYMPHRVHAEDRGGWSERPRGSPSGLVGCGALDSPLGHRPAQGCSAVRAVASLRRMRCPLG